MDQRFEKSIQVINFIIDDLNLDNPKQLSDSLGFERPERIYKILRGKVAISRNLADIIHEKYPKYDKNWLLTGEGSMLNDGNEKEPVANEKPSSYKPHDLNAVHLDLKRDLSELAKGMMHNHGVISDGVFEILAGQEKILEFIEQLDASQIAKTTSKLESYLKERTL